MEWLYSCDTNWHCCTEHKFARAYVEPKLKPDNQNINQDAARIIKKARKMEGRQKRKIAAPNKATKRLREPAMDEREQEEIQFRMHRQHLKRVREPDHNAIIVLGIPIHGGLKPNMCGPKIKKRFIGPPD